MYARYKQRLTFRVGESYKQMLQELSEAAKRPMSEVSRDIFEQSILRRYQKLQNIKKKKSDTIMDAFSD
ncbi:MAG: hypothetical protein FD122_1347 [Stygiobacter sp.]|nr:MAG: hypothetical protein FD122_1347 [Stygiobacter sp.]KAF0218008.1 MAG: hypothetical protein FD178_242 [Ignavibacteria bacterium]